MNLRIVRNHVFGYLDAAYMADRLLILCLMLSLCTATQGLAQESVTSPTGSVEIVTSIDEGRFVFSVYFLGEEVLERGTLSLEFADKPLLGIDLEIADTSRARIQENWQRYWGKRTHVLNHYDRLMLTLRESGGLRRSIEVEFRAYDDGAAFRYILPQAWGEFELAREIIELTFAEEPTVWAANYGGFHASQEGLFRRGPLHDLDPDSVYGLPMLMEVGSAVWAAVTEADLTDWAGMWLAGSNTERTLATRLAPQSDDPEVAVRSKAPRSSPWRVLMLGVNAGDLIETDIIHNLNDPPATDFSWVKPGIASWNWWSGPYLPNTTFEVGMNTPTMKAFVDLAAEMGWKYVLVDEGWYGPAFAPGAVATTWEKHPTSDITTAIPNLDLQELIRYADEKGVRVVLWLHWGHVDDQMEEAFPLYENWGIAGVKIDFMDRDDQQMVNFYHRVARSAARHKLMVDFHGAYKPTGVSRTYPNLVTREGVLGNEYNKWSALVTPEHAVTIPFTRGLLGEMDYTPGGFRNRSISDFRPQHVAPFVIGTRVHELAMFVVYESVFQVAADSPHSYRTSPAGTDFLKIVPTTWDDTGVLNGMPGDYITVARRSGDEWFVASMTDETARTLEIPLDFLGEGTYEAEIWMDADDASEFPERLLKDTRTVTAGEVLQARMVEGGGHIIHLRPIDTDVR